ncbi:MAG: chemotaxis response regulator protein-glutamate methylesterase [Lachnospiraceae bacterium]|jgi:two-component system chemotaxis response regulator CheB|nr:chemotaxis response regulator protein-glutamate methylesterase [Lachnospiraceae bacterium]
MKKNILVVDDSTLMRRVICDIINSDSTFQATDVCRDGLEAYEKLKTTAYDAVILDVNMPRMDGLELLEKLQQDRIKATIIMVSTLTTRDADVTIRAMELGAIDFITKPTNIIEAKSDQFKGRILQMLKAVIKTDVIRTSRGAAIKATDQRENSSVKVPKILERTGTNGKNKLVALACSTGGPKALQSVIPYLPADMNAPMVLVQHMPKGFTKSMAERLDEISKIHVREAQEGDILRKGCVYIAPGGKHMELQKKPDGNHVVRLNEAPAIGGLRPCANITYKSLASSGFDEIVCVVLTGMGADGTEGILALNTKKKIHVISQDAKSCVVYGMPKAIADAGVVDEVVPLTEVAHTIIKNVGVQ